MKICHVSDCHWGFEQYPAADLYVFTGDLLCNYPIRDNRSDSLRGYSGMRSMFVPEHERQMQLEACRKFSGWQFPSGIGMRSYLGSPDAPIICVRGNHDFIAVAPLFDGCNLVHEFVDNEVFELLGHTFTGHRGVPWINGMWNDEMSPPDLMDRVRRMPTADVYVTHYPPHGIDLDGEDGTFYGLRGMLGQLVDRDPGPFDGLPKRLHLFGHIHECGGRTAVRGDILFSQAAMTFNLIDGSRDDGWRDVNPA